jgi:hypothetical protein
MSVEDDDGEMEDVGGSHGDFFDNEPTRQDKIEVRFHFLKRRNLAADHHEVPRNMLVLDSMLTEMFDEAL